MAGKQAAGRVARTVAYRTTKDAAKRSAVKSLRYLTGFRNSFETEALPGALPIGRNSPQKVNYGLYAEQLSGSPFTAPSATSRLARTCFTMRSRSAIGRAARWSDAVPSRTSMT